MAKHRKPQSDQNQLTLGLADASVAPTGDVPAATHEAPPDEAARQRIRTELTRSMLVEAGAGSGKTHEMAARMAAGVASGVYDVQHMAAVTFTRKAAAELRGRFQLALESELFHLNGAPAHGAPGLQPRGIGDAAREARIRTALSNLERFFAGTIHSFCARLLRERPVEAGVSPGFTELDDAEEMMVRRQSWRDYRAQAKAAGDSGILDLLDAGIEPKHLEKAFNTLCDYEDVEFPPGDAEMPDAAAAWTALEAFWIEMRRLLPVPVDPGSKCATQGRCERFARAWKFAFKNDRDTADLAGLLDMWQSKPGVTQKWWSSKAVALEAEALHASFRTAVVIPFLTQWRQYVYRLTVTLLTRARLAAQQERLRRNALSFNDLLLITARVLREKPDVRHSLQQKYRWLFVDEFQDTDPVQAEIMFWLSPTLFVVGDPKQSIYRFRRADIDIYNEVRARIGGPAGDGIVKLTTNFRSVPGLCEWANTVFQTRFPAQHTQHAPAFAPLQPRRTAAEQTEPHLARLVIPEDGDEGDLIARYIRCEVDAKRKTYSDFMVLTRKRKPLRSLARALEELRVPIEVTGAGAFGESEEVRHLALLIAALADPQDSGRLVGVLRGPLFGVSDRDLFAYRQAGGYFSLFSGLTDRAEAPAAAKADGATVDAALESLHRWHGYTRRLPIGAALERILEESGMLALAAASPDGVEAGDLLHAVDRVRAIVEGGFTLADAADTLESWVSDEDGARESSEVDSLPLEPGRPDVVRLMNLHKAKGLEARVVFLADPMGGFKPRADIRIIRHKDSAAQGYFQITREAPHGGPGKVLAEPAGWDTFANDERAYLDAEVDRLLYVAATRAQDLLVVSRPQGKSGGTPAWDEFDAFLGKVPALVVPASVTIPAAQAVDLSSAALTRVMRAVDDAHVRGRIGSFAAVSVTSESKAFPRITPGGADELAEPDDPTRVLSADTPSRRADAGVEWGTLVHGLLEHAMRHKQATRDDLRRLAMWLTLEEPRLRAVVEQALDTVQAVAGADFWSAARASSECYEEVPFSVREQRAGVPTIVSGTIDLAYRDGDGWRILDYKTDAEVAPEDLRKRYAVQLEMYRQAWGRVSGAAVGATVHWARRGAS